jgi:hypothetical protein
MPQRTHQAERELSELVVDNVLRGRRRRALWRTAGAAVQYAAMGWPVCPGAFRPSQAMRSADFLRSCSCDRIGCPAPGAHPVSPAWQTLASTDLELVAGWWIAMPEANVVLPTGHAFDVLDVPAQAGLRALAQIQRSRQQPGPVALGVGDRAHFFVRSRGAPADEHEWWSCHLDCEPREVAEVSGLRWHCRDSYVMAPPSRSGTGESARWIRDPATHELPDSLWLLEVLTDACEEAG